MFNQLELQQAVRKTLETTDVVDPDKRGAFFTAATTEGIKGVLALKVGDVWTVNVYAEHGWHDDHNEAGATLRATW